MVEKNGIEECYLFFFFSAQVQHGKINCTALLRENMARKKSNVSHSLFKKYSLLELGNFSTNKYR